MSGSTAIALYGLAQYSWYELGGQKWSLKTVLYKQSQYALPGTEMTISIKNQILYAMFQFFINLFICVLISFIVLWIYNRGIIDTDPERTIRSYREFQMKYRAATLKYTRMNPMEFLETSLTEIVDITKHIDLPSTKYFRTGAVSVVRNRIVSLRYDIEAWRYCKRGVPSIGLGAYSEMPLEDYKKQLSKSRSNYNSPELNSPYDGIGNVFFRSVLRGSFFM